MFEDWWRFLNLLFTYLFLLFTSNDNSSYYHPIFSAVKICETVEFEAKSKYGFIPTSPTMCIPPSGNLQSIAINFEYRQKLTKKECRLILHNLATMLIEKINANQELRGLLSNYPFDISNVKLTIYITQDEGTRAYYPDLGVASLDSGVFVFKTWDPNVKYAYKTTEEESYNSNDYEYVAEEPAA